MTPFAASASTVPPADSRDITLGILAGGRATRLGGADKAWLRRGDGAQVEWLVARYRDEVGEVLISANREPERYTRRGWRVVRDAKPDLGPIGGLAMFAAQCRTSWLLTLPVDVLQPPSDLLARLHAGANGQGACAVDDDGLQPLVCLWRVEALRAALADAAARGIRAVHETVASAALAPVTFAGLRFGNLNTPADLSAAGITIAPGVGSDG